MLPASFLSGDSGVLESAAKLVEAIGRGMFSFIAGLVLIFALLASLLFKQAPNWTRILVFFVVVLSAAALVFALLVYPPLPKPALPPPAPQNQSPPVKHCQGQKTLPFGPGDP